MTHHDKASLFHALHRRGALVLPNAWDVISARLTVEAGAEAVATTSAGVAWSTGVADGGPLGRERAVDLVARVVAAVEVPVSADIEGGYADTPEGVGRTVARVLDAGAVGVNLEDAHPGGPAPLLPMSDQCERLAAARRAADAARIPMFLNARVDTYLRSVGDPAARLRETLARADAYAEAGADGILVPGVVDPATVTALADGIPVPLNVLAGPGAPSVTALARLGAARISVGSSIAEAAYAVVRHGARELLKDGTYGALAGALGYAELNALSRC